MALKNGYRYLQIWLYSRALGVRTLTKEFWVGHESAHSSDLGSLGWGLVLVCFGVPQSPRGWGNILPPWALFLSACSSSHLDLHFYLFLCLSLQTAPRTSPGFLEAGYCFCHLAACLLIHQQAAPAPAVGGTSTDMDGPVGPRGLCPQFRKVSSQIL